MTKASSTRSSSAARMGDAVAYRNLSAYVDHEVPPVTTCRSMPRTGTFRDLGILRSPVAENSGLTWVVPGGRSESHANGGDACPRDLEAAKAIAQSWCSRRRSCERIAGFHMEMAFIYQMGLQYRVKGFERADLAVAHAVYDCAREFQLHEVASMVQPRIFSRLPAGHRQGLRHGEAGARNEGRLHHAGEHRETHRGAAQGGGLEGDQAPSGRWLSHRAEVQGGGRKVILASGFKLPEENPNPGPDPEMLQQ